MCKSYRDQILARYPGGEVLKEVYLPIDASKIFFKGESFVGTTAGYIDVAVISADQKTAEIIDWKFGAWSVEPAKNNLQGIAYLLGLLFRVPTLEAITVHFVMPHRDEIDFHTFQRADFADLHLRVSTVVARAHFAQTSGNFDRCNVMSPCCLFCGNKGTCTKVAEFALKVGKKYSALHVPENVTPSLMNNSAHAKQSMEVAQLLEAWGKAVRAQITARAIEEDVWLPEGYKLRARTASEITDWRRVVEMAKAAWPVAVCSW